MVEICLLRDSKEDVVTKRTHVNALALLSHFSVTNEDEDSP
jgi:hypothetical protein